MKPIIKQLSQMIVNELNGEENFILRSELEELYKDQIKEKIQEVIVDTFGKQDYAHLLKKTIIARRKKGNDWADKTLALYEEYLEKGYEQVQNRYVNKELIEKAEYLKNNKLELIRTKQTTNKDFESYLEEQIEKDKSQIISWQKEKDYKLCHYIYFRNKRPSDINKSLELDLKVMIYEYMSNLTIKMENGEFILEDDEADFKSNVLFHEQPNVVIEHGNIVPTRSKVSVNLDNPIILEELSEAERMIFQNNADFIQIGSEKHQYYLASLKENSSNSIQFFSQEMVDEIPKVQNGVVKLEGLTPEDYRVFSVILLFREKSFMETSKIYFNEKEALDILHRNRKNKKYSAKDYATFRRSIFKLFNIGLYIPEVNVDKNNIVTNKKHRYFKFISEYEKDEVMNAKGASSFSYTVTVSEMALNYFVNKEITRIYGDYISSLSPLAWTLSFPLQKKRISEANEHQFDSNKVITMDISFNDIRRIYQFSTRKAQSIQAIANALKEMKEAKFLIKNVEHVNEIFKITFLPLSQEEIEDIRKNIALRPPSSSLSEVIEEIITTEKDNDKTKRMIKR